MSLRDCIDEAEAAGDVTPDQARYSRDLFDAIYAENVKTMGPEEADAAAGRQTFNRMKADAAQSKRVKILQAVKFAPRPSAVRVPENHNWRQPQPRDAARYGALAIRRRHRQRVGARNGAGVE